MSNPNLHTQFQMLHLAGPAGRKFVSKGSNLCFLNPMLEFPAALSYESRRRCPCVSSIVFNTKSNVVFVFFAFSITRIMQNSPGLWPRAC